MNTPRGRRSPAEPPRLASWLLAVILPAEIRGTVLGDLAESYAENLHDQGRIRAGWSYWRELRHALTLRREVLLTRRATLGAARSRTGPLHSLLYDLRYSARIVASNRGLAAISTLAIGLGIGLPATMFSIVNGALRDLPFDQSEQLMAVARTNHSRGWDRVGVPASDFAEWQRQQTTFSGLAMINSVDVNISGSERRPERYRGAAVSPNALDLLRTRPLLGRGFDAMDAQPGAPPVMIIGHSVWTNRFAGDPDVIGHTARVNGEPRTIVGVMAEGFRFPSEHDMWLPIISTPFETTPGSGPWFRTFGRLEPSVSLEQASSEFDGIMRRLELAYPETNQGFGIAIAPYTQDFLPREIASILYMMLGVVSFVLVIACANVTNLLLSRAAERGREVAVRTALGASRARVMFQMLMESLVLSITGGVFGLILASLGVWLFNFLSAGMEKAFWMDIRIDGAALLFVGTTVVLATLAAGVAPAVQASGTNVNEVLKDESRGASGFRMSRVSKLLVIGEVALSCALLIAAGLMIKGVVNLRTLDFGFDADQIFVASLELPERGYPESADRVRFFERLRDRLEAIPGVTEATLASHLPTIGQWQTRVGFEGSTSTEGAEYPMTHYARIMPSFFSVFRVEILNGRGFTDDDRDGNLPVAVVNQKFAQRYFGGTNPLGRRIRQGGPDSKQPWLTIVGVSTNAYMTDIENEDPNPAGVYLAHGQAPWGATNIALRTRGNPLDVAPLVRDAVESLDPDLPIRGVDSLIGRVRADKVVLEVFANLFLLFGAAALFLATVGLYGVMSFAVARRTKEMGVRMALGAHTSDVLRLILKLGVLQLVAGLALGVILAGILTQAMTMAFFQVDPWDKWIFTLIVIVLSLTGIAATLVPARRATRVDPMVALRYE